MAFLSALLSEDGKDINDLQPPERYEVYEKILDFISTLPWNGTIQQNFDNALTGDARAASALIKNETLYKEAGTLFDQVKQKKG